MSAKIRARTVSPGLYRARSLCMTSTRPLEMRKERRRSQVHCASGYLRSWHIVNQKRWFKWLYCRCLLYLIVSSIHVFFVVTHGLYVILSCCSLVDSSSSSTSAAYKPLLRKDIDRLNKCLGHKYFSRLEIELRSFGSEVYIN